MYNNTHSTKKIAQVESDFFHICFTLDCLRDLFNSDFLVLTLACKNVKTIRGLCAFYSVCSLYIDSIKFLSSCYSKNLSNPSFVLKTRSKMLSVINQWSYVCHPALPRSNDHDSTQYLFSKYPTFTLSTAISLSIPSTYNCTVTFTRRLSSFLQETSNSVPISCCKNIYPGAWSIHRPPGLTGLQLPELGWRICICLYLLLAASASGEYRPQLQNSTGFKKCFKMPLFSWYNWL